MIVSCFSVFLAGVHACGVTKQVFVSWCSRERGILKFAGGRVACRAALWRSVSTIKRTRLRCVCLDSGQLQESFHFFKPTAGLPYHAMFICKLNKIKQAWQASVNAAKSTSKYNLGAQLTGACTDKTFILNQTNLLLHTAGIYRVNRNNSFHRKPNPKREKEGGREEECPPWSHSARGSNQNTQGPPVTCSFHRKPGEAAVSLGHHQSEATTCALTFTLCSAHPPPPDGN